LPKQLGGPSPPSRQALEIERFGLHRRTRLQQRLVRLGQRRARFALNPITSQYRAGMTTPMTKVEHITAI